MKHKEHKDKKNSADANDLTMCFFLLIRTLIEFKSMSQLQTKIAN